MNGAVGKTRGQKVAIVGIWLAFLAALLVAFTAVMAPAEMAGTGGQISEATSASALDSLYAAGNSATLAATDSSLGVDVSADNNQLHRYVNNQEPDSAPLNLLPAWRWNTGGLVDARSWNDSVGAGAFVTLIGEVANFIFLFASWIWSTVIVLLNFAANFQLFNNGSVTNMIHNIFTTLSDSLMTTGLLMVALAVVLFIAIKRSLAGAPGKSVSLVLMFIIPVAAMQLLATGAAATTTDSDDKVVELPLTSPVGLATKANDIVGESAEKILTPLAAMGRDGSAVSVTAAKQLNCGQYVANLYAAYNEAEKATSGKGGAYSKQVSRLWESGYLRGWVNAQFGNTAAADYMYCHLLEQQSNISQWERFTVAGGVPKAWAYTRCTNTKKGVTTCKSESKAGVLGNGDTIAKGSYQGLTIKPFWYGISIAGGGPAPITAWAACGNRDSKNKTTGPANPRPGWDAIGDRAVDGAHCNNWATKPLPNQVNMNTKDGKADPNPKTIQDQAKIDAIPGCSPEPTDEALKKVCNEAKQQIANDTQAVDNAQSQLDIKQAADPEKAKVHLFADENGNAGKDGILAPDKQDTVVADANLARLTAGAGKSQADNMEGASEYETTYLALWGDQSRAGERLFYSLFAAITALLYAYAVVGLSVGSIIAGIGFALTIAILPVTLFLIAMNRGQQGNNPGIKLLKLTGGLAVAKFVLLAAISLLMILINMVTWVAGTGGSISATLITAVAPIVALIILKAIASRLGFGNIMSMGGAIGMSTAAAVKATGGGANGAGGLGGKGFGKGQNKLDKNGLKPKKNKVKDDFKKGVSKGAGKKKGNWLTKPAAALGMATGGLFLRNKKKPTDEDDAFSKVTQNNGGPGSGERTAEQQRRHEQKEKLTKEAEQADATKQPPTTMGEREETARKGENLDRGSTNATPPEGKADIDGFHAANSNPAVAKESAQAKATEAAKNTPAPVSNTNGSTIVKQDTKAAQKLKTPTTEAAITAAVRQQAIKKERRSKNKINDLNIEKVTPKPAKGEEFK